MNLNNYKRFHFVGIGGVGMRALAKIMIDKGYMISGSDNVYSSELENLRKLGVEIFVGHNPQNIKNADVLIVSTAISKNNSEVLEAKKHKIPVFHRSDLLAAILCGGKSICVAGAHGKSTTSAMIGKVFCDAEKHPTVVLGGKVDYLNGNSIFGNGEFVIAEADESDGSFLKFNPFISVITNIEDDHLDHYLTVENIKNAFIKFINQTDKINGNTILCIDNEGVKSILPKLDENSYITYGTSDNAEYKAINKRYIDSYMMFDVYHKESFLGTVSLMIPGTHNVRNALAALVTGLICGIDFKTIAKSLMEFNGVKRRFQIKYSGEVKIVDDYAHHPTEIMSTLKAAKECGKHRVICAFQPHRYSRTNLLKYEFANAFDNADIIFITDIYSAGEKPINGISGKMLVDLIKEKHPTKTITYIKNMEDLPEAIKNEMQKDDMIITMGAGNIYRVGEDLIMSIKERDND